MRKKNREYICYLTKVKQVVYG